MTTAEASLSPPFSAVVFFLEESFAKPPLSSGEVAVDSPQWARNFGSGATRSERPAGYPKLTKRRDKERRLPFRPPPDTAYFSAVPSSKNSRCSARTASSALRSGITQVSMRFDVLIRSKLILSFASVVNMRAAIPGSR